MNFMKKAIYLGFSLLLLPLQTIANNPEPETSIVKKNPPSLTGKINSVIHSVLNTFTKSPIDRLISYMDHTIEAQAYWKYLRYHPIKRIVSKTPLSWATSSWKSELDEHLKYLEALQAHLAHLLSSYEKKGDVSLYDFDSYEGEIVETLHSHGVPIFYKRMWLPLTAGACTLGAILYYSPELTAQAASYWTLAPGQAKVMFEFNATEEQLREIKNRLRHSSQFPTFHAVLLKGKAYITTNNNNVLAVGAVLGDIVGREAFNLRVNLSVKDRLIYAWNRFREITVDPYFDAEYSYKQKLITNAQHILNSHEHDDLFTRAERTTRRIADERKESISALKEIRDSVFKPFDQLQKEGTRRVKVLAHEVLPQFSVARISPINYPDPGPLSPLDQSYLETLPSEVNYYGETAKFSLKALIGSYLLYKGTRYLTHTTYNWFTRSSIAHPLKQDLVHFERVLTHAQSESDNKDYYNGMIFFFNKKLDAYLAKVPKKFKNRFIQDKEDLQSTKLSFHQKFLIVHAMLRDYTFLE